MCVLSLRRPTRSTRTDNTLSLLDALQIFGLGGVAGAGVGRSGPLASKGRARAHDTGAGPDQAGSLACPRIGDAAPSRLAARGGRGAQRPDDRGDDPRGARAGRSHLALRSARGSMAGPTTGARPALAHPRPAWP